MSDLLLSIAVTGAAPGKAIGIKEAIAMDLESMETCGCCGWRFGRWSS